MYISMSIVVMAKNEIDNAIAILKLKFLVLIFDDSVMLDLKPA